MLRRHVLKAMGAAGVGGSLAGCGSLGGTEQSTDTVTPGTESPDGGCGPGADEIATLAAAVRRTETAETTGTAELFAIRGEILSLGDDAIVIDDGTGTATLTTLLGGGFATRDVAVGDCAETTGVPAPPEDGDDTDITFFVEEIGLAET